MPLVNADRMMLSILPEPTDGFLPDWAARLRDGDLAWMAVAQRGVDSFVAHATRQRVPFAVETVFSHWRELPDGRVESKIDRITEMQANGYLVILFFVGLRSAKASAARVATRVARGGHAVEPRRLLARFPRTQHAIRAARGVADAAVLMDNSRSLAEAFTLCRAELGGATQYDVRDAGTVHPAIAAWLNIVCPP